MMATNLSDDGSAPVDFNLSSTIDDNESKNSGLREKCLLCNNLRKTFYCKTCIANGDFVSSTPQNPERYADKKLLWLRLKNDKQILSTKCLKFIEKMEVKVKLQTEINQCKGRIKLLVQLIKKKNEVIKKANKDIEMIKEKNSSRVTRLPRNKDRVEKLESYVANNMKMEIRQRTLKVAKAELELKKIVQKNIKDLIKYIFPICKIDAISKSQEELESTDTVSALAEATRTSYVRGKWVFMDSTGDLHYRIVAPTLPGSGEYSAYSDWVAANKNGLSGNEKMDENQAYNISAALCYTTQLVNLLAFYLDVLLPNRLSYVDFYSTDISDNKFYKKISKLNTNILYLCFSQGVDTSLLNPKHTLCNLLHLVNHSDLGKTEPFEIDSNLFLSLENYGADMKTEDCSEDEENDVVPSEWEAIPLVPCPESVPGSATFSTQMPSMHATTSMAGGLVTSLASMWRGWAGNRLLSQHRCVEEVIGKQEILVENYLSVLEEDSNPANAHDTDETFILEQERFFPEEIKIAPPPSFTYNLRNREVNKKVIEKLDNWGLVGNQKKVDEDDVETKSNSQESISLLRECYADRQISTDFPQLRETCMKSTIELIDSDSDEDIKTAANLNGQNCCSKKNKNVQTDFSLFNDCTMKESDEEGTRHVNFLGNLIKLKVFFSTQEDIRYKTLSELINTMWSGIKIKESKEIELGDFGIRQETMGYFLKFVDTDDVLEETVKGVLIFLSEELEKNLLRIATCWKNSLYEEAVEMTIRAVDREPRLSRLVEAFLRGLVASIATNEQQSKCLALECKAEFVVNFCQSTYLSFFTINLSIETLKNLKELGHAGENCLFRKYSVVHLTKNAYYILRILEALLKLFKTKLNEMKIDEVFCNREEENFNVLETWKKHWKCKESSKTKKDESWLKVAVSRWSKDLDDLLLHCVKNVRLISPPVERCGRLASDIFNFCNKRLFESGALLFEN